MLEINNGEVLKMKEKKQRKQAMDLGTATGNESTNLPTETVITHADFEFTNRTQQKMDDGGEGAS